MTYYHLLLERYPNNLFDNSIVKACHDQTNCNTKRERKKVAKLLIDDPKAPDIKRGKQLVFIL